MSEQPAQPTTDLPANKVMESSWVWKLLLMDGVLALGLAWILWDLFQGRQEAERAEAQPAETPAAIESER